MLRGPSEAGRFAGGDGVAPRAPRARDREPAGRAEDLGAQAAPGVVRAGGLCHKDYTGSLAPERYDTVTDSLPRLQVRTVPDLMPLVVIDIGASVPRTRRLGVGWRYTANCVN